MHRFLNFHHKPLPLYPDALLTPNVVWAEGITSHQVVVLLKPVQSPHLEIHSRQALSPTMCVQQDLPFDDSGVTGEGIVWDHQLSLQHWGVPLGASWVGEAWKAHLGAASCIDGEWMPESAIHVNQNKLSKIKNHNKKVKYTPPPQS